MNAPHHDFETPIVVRRVPRKAGGFRTFIRRVLFYWEAVITAIFVGALYVNAIRLLLQ